MVILVNLFTQCRDHAEPFAGSDLNYSDEHAALVVPKSPSTKTPSSATDAPSAVASSATSRWGGVRFE